MSRSDYIRTDLASELRPTATKELPGVHFSEEQKEGLRISRLQVEPSGEALVGKPAGDYITVEIGQIWQAEKEQLETARAVLGKELRALCNRLAPGFSTVLVAGLGNRKLTVDAIGPEAVAEITVTGHLQKSAPALFRALGQKCVMALAPGVVGQTGMETATLLRQTVEAVKPDLVLAIDALAARSMERLCTTVQLTGSGICPGSGVGNKREAVSKKTLGVPVIAIGVPTVADSSTLVWDALEQAGIEEPSEALQKVLEEGRGFFVSVRDSDLALRALSTLLAAAIDDALAV